MLLIAALSLVLSIFVPIWRIDLDAPQYPEGLVLQIFANKLGGQVDIINGLNHYIGMGTLHAEDFVEFTVLPYIISVFALISLLVALKGSRKGLYFLLFSFILFGIVAMVDFYRWEYEYGHNLDPNAAIIVPGQAYQPPLIGFKQLLNFGAYSVPDIGGWLFIGAGILMLLASIMEKRTSGKNKGASLSVLILPFLFLMSCADPKPVPIQLNKDDCTYCKMSIADGRFGAEIVTVKGRTYPFDDIQCLIEYKSENKKAEVFASYVNDYSKKNELIKASDAYFVMHEEVKSPMGGNYAAFLNEADAKVFADKYKTNILRWKEISK